MAKIELSKNASLILEKRYLKKDDNGNLKEKVEDLFNRVAENIAFADLKYRYKEQIQKITEKYNKEFYDIVNTEEFKKLVKNNKNVKQTAEEFYKLMSSFEFLPNSPTLLNAGRKLKQLAACFVLPIEDDISSIFMSLHDAALIHKTGAGTGFNFSKLRHKGDIIETAGYTSGPVSFMKVFDSATEQVKLGGYLRGANMGILNVNYPDIEEFITIKSKERTLTNFNISVAITDKFMDAIKKNKYYDIISPRTKEVIKKENAKRILRLISKEAWKNGDPGVLFIDRINELNPTPKLGKIESTDSCGEQPLLAYESCNLGSINLSKFVKGKKVDFKKLKKVVHSAVHFLDNVIDMCNYPLKQNREIVEQNRKIGLGVMGFADMLIQLETAYDSNKAVKTAQTIMKFISKESDLASSELAKQRLSFPSWQDSIYNKKSKCFKGKHMILRNATRTTIAPTGTISIIADVSSSIEPLFALSYVRRTAEGEELFYFHKNLKIELEKNKLYTDEIIESIQREGTIKNLKNIPKKIKDLYKVGSDIAPEWHVKMQAAFQKYVDNGISKTVTLPKNATIEDVEKIYLMAYELGCKGISIYRFGSREGQVIFLSSQRDEQISLSGWVKKKRIKAMKS